MATIALKSATCARGAGDNMAGSNFSAGRTVIAYVGGQYAGVFPTGQHDTVTTRGATSGICGMPDTTKISSGLKTVTAKDGTDGTTATTTVTLS